MNKTTNKVFKAICDKPMTIDELVEWLDIPISSVKAAVGTLCKNKHIDRGDMKLNSRTGRNQSEYKATGVVVEKTPVVFGKQTWCSPLEWGA